jgi:cell division cycle 20-like protein 1 (cofactor of APC complex)
MRSARLEAKFGANAHDDIHTPKLPSPPATNTPPTITHGRSTENNSSSSSSSSNNNNNNPKLDNLHAPSTSSRKTSAAIDADALSKALQQFEDAARPREHTPGESPKRKRQRVYTDRFIPNRAGQDLHASYSLLHDQGSPATPHRSIKKPPANELHAQRTDDANRTYSSILRSEMFSDEIPQSIPQHDRSLTPPANFNLTPSTPHKNLFSYKSTHPTPTMTPHSRTERGPNLNARSDIYSLSPVKLSSQSMLLSPRKTPRAVSKVPYKVLDAPELADDFYLNLVDWGSGGVLAVGLGDSVYLWNSETGKVEQLCKLTADTVTSVGWIQRGSHLAVGTGRGHVLIFDTLTQRRLRTMIGHSARVSSLAWNSHVLSTGSRDRTILHRDVRSPQQYLSKLVGHKQEVCGLRWNSDTNQLASGGNDNKIFIWNNGDDRWLHRWGEQEGGHKAAVKAIAWSPHQRGLLASGGGTADRCIKFWNTISTAQHSANAALTSANSTHAHLDLTSASLSALPSHQASPDPMNLHQSPNLLRSHDTGSQVCNLLFSTLTSELVSTHGFSQHAINIWKYPSMSQVVSLTGHTYRVLYLSMSPDGSVIVTGAGDETLRFWDAFGTAAKSSRSENSVTGKGSLVKEWNVIR